MGFIRNVRKGFMYFHNGWAPSEEELALLDEYVTDEERALFMQMDRPDQQHSFEVTRHCAESLQHFPDLDKRVMMKAALLHDIGKIGARLSLVFRTFWVLAHKPFPCFCDRLAESGADARPGSLRYKMWLQIEHANLGAERLREMGVGEDVCELVIATGQRKKPKELDPDLARRIIIAADGDHVIGPDGEWA